MSVAAGSEARGVLHGITPRTLRAYLYIRAGRPESARPLLGTVLDINRKAQDDDDRRSWFETVAAHALLGNREAAVAAWERVVGQGFPDAAVDVYHPLLASIKDDSHRFENFTEIGYDAFPPEIDQYGASARPAQALPALR